MEMQVELDSIDPEAEPGTIEAAGAQSITVDSIDPEAEPGTISLGLDLNLDSIVNQSQPATIIVYEQEDTVKPGVLIAVSGGVSRRITWKQSTFRLTRSTNGRDTGSFSQRLIEGDVPLEPGDEVTLIWLDDLKFGGLVESTTESALDGQDEETNLAVTLSGYGAYWDRITIHKKYTLPLGAITKIILFDIWLEHLTQFGVTYDYSGPVAFCGEMTFHYISGTETKRQLELRSPNHKIWIDENKRLRYENITSPDDSAPFSITDGSSNWKDLSVTRSRSQKRNRMWVLPSKDIQSISTELFTADGTEQSFPTLYNLDIKPIVKLDGVAQVVTPVGIYPAGFQVTYVPGGVGVFFITPPTAGQVVSIQSPIPFNQATKSEDEADIAANGLYESSYQAKDMDTLEAAQSLGDGLLPMYVGDTETGELSTNDVITDDQWLRPGMGITINKTKPNMSGTYTVESCQDSEQDGVLWRHTYQLRKGPGFDLGSSNINEIQVASRVSAVAVRRRISVYMGKETFISTGVVPGFESIPVVPGGVSLDSWDFRFLDAPLGSDVIIDILVDGSSIFPVGNANKPHIPAGSTDTVSGFNFLTPGQRYAGGEAVQFNIIQVGSTSAGRLGTGHLVFRS